MAAAPGVKLMVELPGVTVNAPVPFEKRTLPVTLTVALPILTVWEAPPLLTTKNPSVALLNVSVLEPKETATAPLAVVCPILKLAAVKLLFWVLTIVPVEVVAAYARK